MIKLYFKSGGLKVVRPFSTIKAMTQYIRRNNIMRYQMYDKDGQFVIMGNRTYHIRYLEIIIRDAEEKL